MSASTKGWARGRTTVVLRTRLHRAAVRLRRSDESVSAIAFDAGFNDLSTFNRRFRRVIGVSPSAYRTGRGVPSTTTVGDDGYPR